ncbi:MAG: restriction endonuclease subunit S [Desulfobaccales bacterium]|jgi:type I restriction enzyme S subunit
MRSGWQRKKIGDLCEVIAGQSPDGRFYNSVGNGMPFYQGKKGFGEKFIGDPTTWTMQVTKIARKGDILMSMRAPVGPVNFATDEICIGRGLGAIRSKPELNCYFLFYQLLLLQPEIAGKEGAVFASINKSEIEALPISFAPLPEQQRIVGILDEAFGGIATAKANAEKNLQNARALFKSHLHEVFTQRSPGWVEKPLGDVCTFIGGSQPPKSVFSKTQAADNVRLIQIRDYKSDKHVVFIPRSQARRLCKADDIMIGRYGPPIFQILRGLEGAYNVALMKAVPDESKLSRDFLFYFLKHSAIQQYVIFHSERAAGQSGLNKDTLEPYPIAYPSLKEQVKVVHVNGELESAVERLAALYQQKLAALDALKKSLLHQAFSGEL